MVAALSLFVLITALLAGTAPTFFGYESFVVLSGSMEPAIGVGDLAVVGPVRPDDLIVGDVITYRTAQRPDIVVTHRLVNIGLDERGRLSFQTKGAPNDSVDPVRVDPGAVLGRVAFPIPKLGYLVEFSKRAEGKVLLIGIPGLLLVLDTLLGARRRRKGEARPEVRPVRHQDQTLGTAGELLAGARIALANGETGAALALAKRAIALDPHSAEAWLLEAECLPPGQERAACLRAGLTVNPDSMMLAAAVGRAAVLECAG